MKPHVKQILLGFAIGIGANIIGTILYILLFSEYNIKTTLNLSLTNNFFGKLITLGAILNLVVFFYFIRKNKIYLARGVMMATILAALAIMIHKFL